MDNVKGIQKKRLADGIKPHARMLSCNCFYFMDRTAQQGVFVLDASPSLQLEVKVTRVNLW